MEQLLKEDGVKIPLVCFPQCQKDGEKDKKDIMHSLLSQGYYIMFSLGHLHDTLV